jgi:putative SOS response-associated peptidase YedK
VCYSAQVWEAYGLYVRKHGADIDIREFHELYGFRAIDRRIKIPKAIDANFAPPGNDTERAIKTLIDAFDRQELARHEQELFKQRKRLADAERKLLSRTTKAALENRRIATDKVQWLLGRISDIKRTELVPRDSRIFPGHYALVMVSENGRRLVKPMRYQCRPEGKPAFYDTRYPGTYNARRDNLEGFWKNAFGYSHAVMVVDRFYENVERINDEGKPYNTVLEFQPKDGSAMIVACLWSRWTDPEGAQPDLLSFAAITDEPPAEVAAAGHDRCIVPIKVEHIDAWLNPDPANLQALYRILDDRERPYYEHRMAA